MLVSIDAMGVCCCKIGRNEGNACAGRKYTWYFSAGTIVHGANDIKECRKMMYDTTNRGNATDYWANQVANGIYEIQFTPESFPNVTVLVAASCGHDAATIARRSLAEDYKSHKVNYIS